MILEHRLDIVNDIFYFMTITIAHPDGFFNPSVKHSRRVFYHDIAENRVGNIQRSFSNVLIIVIRQPIRSTVPSI